MTVTNHGARAARDRADELRRDRAGAARRGPRAPGVREPVRRDRVARVVHGDHRHAAAALGDGAARSGACTWSTPGAERVGDVTLRDRPRALHRPRALDARSGGARCGRRRSRGTTGAVLDPIFALRTRVRLAPGQSASVAFTTLVATTRERAFELADRYHDPHAAQRALDLAWTATQVELRELGHHARRCRGLPGARRPPASTANPALRAAAGRAAARTRLAAAALAHGISGDWPILLATIDSPTGCRRCASSSPRTATGAGAA